MVFWRKRHKVPGFRLPVKKIRNRTEKCRKMPGTGHDEPESEKTGYQETGYQETGYQETG
jgi:hypothetical protein